ncbi:flagellar hook-basal body complex protein [Alicyclobacillus sp. SP_1]|uniref:flagellar hook-basal body complex protein n=1 Tax=Alicyclobacillus sp. SP_1 TaxID=2942475 RepID=UPI0021581CD4|nr:flagellar hook-basal body complex protein [Alicyclobacillus sp. SP_1]
MLRSLGSAVSGMDAFQTDLDVVGNNIANVNTIGYKSASTVFSDMLSQTVASASAPSASGTNGGLGGINSQQVGLGTQIAAITNEWTQGADQTTGNPLDVAINGAGVFVASPMSSNGNYQYSYSRAGDFNLDSASNLVLPNGMVVMGYGVNSTGDYYSTPGGAASSTAPTNAPGVPMNITALTQGAGGAVTGATNNPANTTWTLAANPNVSISSTGAITVTDTQGNVHTIGNLALATFPNYSGLQKIGDSMWQTSSNSGAASYQIPSTTSGTLQSGAVEQSNVDLTKQFADMIVAQNGYAANSQVIATDKQILQTLMNNV